MCRQFKLLSRFATSRQSVFVSLSSEWRQVSVTLDTCRLGLCPNVSNILFLYFQLACDHRKPKDPHPLCESCALIHDVALCTPSATCSLCFDTDSVVWKRILKAQQKREYRLRVRLASAGDRISASTRKSVEDNVEDMRD